MNLIKHILKLLFASATICFLGIFNNTQSQILSVHWETELINKSDKIVYNGTFNLEDSPKSEMVTFRFGDSSNIDYSSVYRKNLYFYSTVYLNNLYLGEIVGRYEPLVFCIPSSLLKKGENEVQVNRFNTGIKSVSTSNLQKDNENSVNLIPDTLIHISDIYRTQAIDSVYIIDNTVILKLNNSKIKIAVLPHNIISVRYVKGIETETLMDKIGLVSMPEKLHIGISKSKNECIVNSDSLSLCIQKRDANIDIRRKDGTVVVNNLRFSGNNQFSVLQWNLNSSEHIFGLGENTVEGMDKRGKYEDIWVNHSWEKCDKPIPFLLSTQGYGLHLHSSYRSGFDLGRIKKDQAYSFVNDNQVQLYIYSHSTFPKIVSDYTMLTGRSPLPPRWAFGYWHSTTEDFNQKECTENIALFNEKKIPIDVIAIDPFWQERTYQSWKWDKKNYPDPQKFLDMLESYKVKLSLWSCPFISNSSVLFPEASKNNYLMLDGSGNIGDITSWINLHSGLMDFTNPKAVDWWGRKLSPLIESGVSVLKIDGGDGNETPTFLKAYDGKSMKEIHNLYPVLFAKATYGEASKYAGNRRILTFIRTGFIGIQRYPVCWGGDQNADFFGGRVLIKAGQQAGLMGIPYWTHDMGGFGWFGNDEYYIRSMQWGALSPLSRAHGRTKTVWQRGEKVENIVKKYLNLRYKLIPTLYSYAYSSHVTGKPMMRAMVYEFQNDTNTYKAEYQYMLGPDMLVAPIYEDCENEDLSATRKVYLPKGEWYNFNTNQLVEGGRYIETVSKIEEFPVFVNKGSMLVGQMETLRASTIPDTLNVYIYSGANADFEFYEDDGQTHSYLNDEYIKMQFQWNNTTHQLSINSQEGSYYEAPKERTIRVFVIKNNSPNCFFNNSTPNFEFKYSGESISKLIPL